MASVKRVALGKEDMVMKPGKSSPAAGEGKFSRMPWNWLCQATGIAPWGVTRPQARRGGG